MVFTRRSLWPSFGMPALDISISSSFTYYSTSNYECTIWLVWLTYDQWNILKNEEHQTDKPKEKIPPLVSHLESTSQEPLPSANGREDLFTQSGRGYLYQRKGSTLIVLLTPSETQSCWHFTVRQSHQNRDPASVLLKDWWLGKFLPSRVNLQ